MNHKWQDNVCVNCGLHRMMRSWKILMCIVNHPPWEVWEYGRSWYYGYQHKDCKSLVKGFGFKRPDCKKQLV